MCSSLIEVFPVCAAACRKPQKSKNQQCAYDCRARFMRAAISL
jgi:hypothetical protein